MSFHFTRNRVFCMLNACLRDKPTKLKRWARCTRCVQVGSEPRHVENPLPEYWDFYTTYLGRTVASAVRRWIRNILFDFLKIAFFAFENYAFHILFYDIRKSSERLLRNQREIHEFHFRYVTKVSICWPIPAIFLWRSKSPFSVDIKKLKRNER